MRAIVIALSLGMLLSGCQKISCAKNDRFDPRGSDQHIKGEWTIEGLSGDAASCSNQSMVDGGVGTITISQIELVVWNEDETEPWTSNRLRVDCEAGTENTIGVPIDTTTDSDGEPGPTLAPLLKAGVYRFQWVAVASNGDLIDCKALETVSIPEPIDAGMSDAAADPIPILPADFQFNATCTDCPCS